MSNDSSEGSDVTLKANEGHKDHHIAIKRARIFHNQQILPTVL